MPTPEQILNGLAFAANNYSIVSILWHLLVLIFLALAIAGRIQTNKQVMAFSTFPVLSVGIIALLTSNPFNGIIFSAFFVILWMTIFLAPRQELKLRWGFFPVIGIVMILFGLVYPHFIEKDGCLHYLFMAPTGLIPCPTLSLVIGLTLLFQGFHHRKWMWYLSCIGLFYGVFGVMRLGVLLDVVLIVGAGLLLGYSIISNHKKNNHSAYSTK